MGLSKKLLGLTDSDRSKTTRKSACLSDENRMFVTAVPLKSFDPSGCRRAGLAKVVSGRSITKRSGFSRTNSVWSKGSLTSNTNRVFSGEAWSLMLLTVGLANAAEAKKHDTIKPQHL